WGLNNNGQLGDGTIDAQGNGRSTPRPLAGFSDVTAIAAGALHTLARRADGSVWAWGDNSEGSLGDGTLVTRGTPRPVQGLGAVVRMPAGSYSAGVKADGTVWAWGANGYGQLGDGTYIDRMLPVPLGLTGI